MLNAGRGDHEGAEPGVDKFISLQCRPRRWANNCLYTNMFALCEDAFVWVKYSYTGFGYASPGVKHNWAAPQPFLASFIRSPF